VVAVCVQVRLAAESLGWDLYLQRCQPLEVLDGSPPSSLIGSHLLGSLPLTVPAGVPGPQGPQLDGVQAGDLCRGVQEADGQGRHL